MGMLRDSINANSNIRVSKHFLDYAIENLTALSALRFYTRRLLSVLYIQLHPLITLEFYSGTNFIYTASFMAEEYDPT